MGHSFIKHVVQGQDRYLVWSSVVDAPITYGGTLRQLRGFWKKKYGERGLEDLDRGIAGGRQWWLTVEDVVGCNRAGKDETKLTAEQIVKHYFMGGPPNEVPTGESWSDIFAREDAEGPAPRKPTPKVRPKRV